MSPPPPPLSLLPSRQGATDETHPDFLPMAECVAKLQEIQDEIISSEMAFNEVATLQDMTKRLAGAPDDIVSHGRLIRAGTLVKVVKKQQARECFLLNDVLIYAAKKTFNGLVRETRSSAVVYVPGQNLCALTSFSPLFSFLAPPPSFVVPFFRPPPLPSNWYSHQTLSLIPPSRPNKYRVART